MTPSPESRPKAENLFHYPLSLPEERWKYSKLDLKVLTARGEQLKISPPELRVQLNELAGFNNERRNFIGPIQPDIDNGVKTYPWEAGVRLLTQATENMAFAGLTVDEKTRIGARAIERALPTFQTKAEVDAVETFAEHIHDAIKKAWEDAKRVKTNTVVQKQNIISPLEENQNIADTTAETQSTEKNTQPELALNRYDIESIYMREATQHPLLTAAQEVAYAKQFKAGNLAKELLQDPDLSEERRLELETDVELGAEAKTHMMEANLRLVIYAASKYLDQKIELLDLIQEGNIGLNRAVEKFDYRKGYRFSTYAYWWIKQALTKTIANEARTIRIPNKQLDAIRKQNKLNDQMYMELGRWPTEKELAEAMGYGDDLTKVRENWLFYQTPISTETPVPGIEEQDMTIGNSIKDPTVDIELEAVDNDLIRRLGELMQKTLSDKEKMILKSRFQDEKNI